MERRVPTIFFDRFWLQIQAKYQWNANHKLYYSIEQDEVLNPNGNADDQAIQYGFIMAICEQLPLQCGSQWNDKFQQSFFDCKIEKCIPTSQWSAGHKAYRIAERW